MVKTGLSIILSIGLIFISFGLFWIYTNNNQILPSGILLCLLTILPLTHILINFFLKEDLIYLGHFDNYIKFKNVLFWTVIYYLYPIMAMFYFLFIKYGLASINVFEYIFYNILVLNFFVFSSIFNGLTLSNWRKMGDFFNYLVLAFFLFLPSIRFYILPLVIKPSKSKFNIEFIDLFLKSNQSFFIVLSTISLIILVFVLNFSFKYLKILKPKV
ncbi:hypothetical protein [uncultured Marivirga sp.]|jgi:hypothetical protein|uniref:hypothetical protein n=1 Tax=uncultured Marivirga sp. TaxID=1123707 RepID=UPI0030EE3604|tara:strand:+ start:69318 stop:69962 length:645 start_codon:yes stop_codon:yes gene_type:complete